MEERRRIAGSIRLLMVLWVTSLAVSCSYQDMEVDLIVHNARIYTVDGAARVVEAMAVDSGRLVALGAEREILNAYTADQMVNAEGRAIYPGFIDSHTHFIEYGLRASALDLSTATSWDECLQMIAEYRDTHPTGWILGGSWDQNNWQDKTFPDNAALDSIVPDRPVLLNRVDLHAAIANTNALELAGIRGATRVRGGEVQLDDEGRPTGILIDRAVDLVSRFIPVPDEEQLKEAIRVAEQDCFEYGLTAVVEAGLDTNKISILDRMSSSGESKIRVYAMLEASYEGLSFMKKGKILKDRFSVRSVKIFSDGALGSRGAALKRHYHDHPEGKGTILHQPVFFRQWAALCDLYDFQLNTHCIGDRASQLLLAIYGDQLEGTNDKRWRIEHAQVITGKDMQKFGRFNILPSVQPTHAVSDMPWAEDRLGPERITGAYANRTLLEQNGIIFLGTDFPVESPEPLRTFYAAVYRKNEQGEPSDGWYPEEALSREQTLMGMTIWGAIGMFWEDRIGSLEVGKEADFIIMDRDIMTCPEEDIMKAKVQKTYVHGEEVFSR